MELEQCPRCGQQVVYKSDGTCPSCGTRVTRGVDDPFGLPQTSFEDEIRRTRRDTFDEPEDFTREEPAEVNPFEAPLAADSGYMAPHERKLSSWMLWLLFSFEGRIPRRAYWGATLLSTVAFFALILLCSFVLMLLFGDNGEDAVFGIVILVAYIPMLWSTLAIAAKRWHDRNKSGWWQLILFVPYIGSLWQFIECGCLRGTVGPNDFGSDPT